MTHRSVNLAPVRHACRLAVGRDRYDLVPHWNRHHPTLAVVVACSPSRLRAVTADIRAVAPLGVSVVVHRRRRTVREWWHDVAGAVR